MPLISPTGSLNQNTTDKNWRNRRSQKLDKMELLNLQSSLQSEIQAKAAISEELSRTRAELIAAQKYTQLSHLNIVTTSKTFFIVAEICEKRDSDMIPLAAI